MQHLTFLAQKKFKQGPKARFCLACVICEIAQIRQGGGHVVGKECLTLILLLFVYYLLLIVQYTVEFTQKTLSFDITVKPKITRSCQQALRDNPNNTIVLWKNIFRISNIYIYII